MGVYGLHGGRVPEGCHQASPANAEDEVYRCRM